jgi:hypothetical protein
VLLPDISRTDLALLQYGSVSSVDLGLNDDGREVKRQKLADDDSTISMGDLAKSEITEVVTFVIRSFLSHSSCDLTRDLTMWDDDVTTT